MNSFLCRGTSEAYVPRGCELTETVRTKKKIGREHVLKDGDVIKILTSR